MYTSKVVWQRSIDGSGTDITLWEKDGNQYIYNIIETEDGSRTCKLEFNVYPKYLDELHGIDAPSIHNVVYLTQGSRQLAFIVIESEFNLDEAMKIYCATSGYLLTASLAIDRNVKEGSSDIEWCGEGTMSKDWQAKRLWEYAINFQDDDYVAFAAPIIYTSDATAVSKIGYETAAFKLMSTLLDQLATDYNSVFRFIGSWYSSENKKWKEYIQFDPIAKVNESAGTTYTYSNISAIKNYTKKNSLDNYYNCSFVYYGTSLESGKYWYHGDYIGSDVIARWRDKKSDTYDVDQIRKDSAVAWNTGVFFSGVDVDISVNPAEIEKDLTNPIIPCDILKFTDMYPVTGEYYVTAVKRYIDNPSKSQYTLDMRAKTAIDLKKPVFKTDYFLFEVDEIGNGTILNEDYLEIPIQVKSDSSEDSEVYYKGTLSTGTYSNGNITFTNNYE